jgi:hypothetical protein
MVTGPATHICPVWRCAVTVDNRYLMCGPHWGMVARALQRAVYTHYAGGAGLYPNGLPRPELAAAQLDAVAYVNARLGGPPPRQIPNPVADK